VLELTGQVLRLAGIAARPKNYLFAPYKSTMKTITNTFRVKSGETKILDDVWRFDKPGMIQKMVVKAVVEEGGKVEMKGKIIIEKDAINTEAYLDQRVMLLGKGAVGVVAQPELEIECNQVKASHAASVGPVNPDQLFYLMARGKSYNEALELLVEAFLNDKH